MNTLFFSTWFPALGKLFHHTSALLSKMSANREFLPPQTSAVHFLWNQLLCYIKLIEQRVFTRPINKYIILPKTTYRHFTAQTVLWHATVKKVVWSGSPISFPCAGTCFSLNNASFFEGYFRSISLYIKTEKLVHQCVFNQCKSWWCGNACQTSYGRFIILSQAVCTFTMYRREKPSGSFFQMSLNPVSATLWKAKSLMHRWSAKTVTVLYGNDMM